jgi:hypothetical protein
MASVNTLLCFAGPHAEPNSIGLAAVNRARMAGLSDDQIRGMISAEDLVVGEKAKKELALI